MRRDSMGLGGVGAAALMWMALGSGVDAQVPVAAPQSSAGETRLKEVAAAYRKIDAYADQGLLKLTYSQRGVPHEVTARVPLRFVRSERMVWDATVTGMAVDKERLTLVNQNTSQPFSPLIASDFVGPVPVETQPAIALRSLAKPPDPEQMAIVQVGGPQLLVYLATLMTAPDAPTRIAQQSSWIRTYQSVFNDRLWRVVDIQPRGQAPLGVEAGDQGPPVGIWIDPDTNLVQWMVMELERDAEEKDDVGDIRLWWSSGAIVTSADRVRLETEATTKQLLDRSRDLLPKVVGPVSMPPAAVDQGIAPGQVPELPKAVPQAPGKLAPPSAQPAPAMLDAPNDFRRVVPISRLIQTASGQAPLALTPSDALLDRLLRRLLRPTPKRAIVPAQPSNPSH